jgi:hypothetical protein
LLLVAAVAALVLTQMPGASRADEAWPPAEEGPKNVVRYMTCATTLGLAPTVFTAISAFFMCAKMFTEEMPT